MTNEQVHISCLATIKNGEGEGFLAITPDGTKYWFDWMARHLEPRLKYVSPTLDEGEGPFIYEMHRYRHVLYVSRVEDRFGNWVDYTYTNTATQPGKLTRIASNDGREITINYSGSTLVSVSDGSRTWDYAYGSTSSGRGTLTTVTQPDGAVWSIDLAAFTDAEIETLEYTPLGEEIRSCTISEIPQNYAAEPVGTMTHPSGAVGSFRLFLMEHGRSNVPVNCRNVTTTTNPPSGVGNNKNDDSPLYPIRYYAFTLKQKTLSGPGMTTAAWNYQYAPNISIFMPEGVTHAYPVCSLGYHECMAPACTDDSCAGSSVTTVTGPDGEWVRHRYGNSYRYNEGKLVSVEVGSGSTSSTPLRKTTHSYDLSQEDGPYMAKWGAGQRAYGDSFQSEYHRPLVKTVTVQDYAEFVWEVATGCNEPGEYCMDSLARPTRVTRSGTVSTAATGNNPVLVPSKSPTLTAPATSTTGNYSLSWTTVPLTSAYEVRERLGSGTWISIHNASGTSTSVSGKTSGNWNYLVRACNVVDCSAWSAIKTTVVTLPPGSAPTLTVPATNTTGHYGVSWTTVSGATRYELQERTNGGAWSEIYGATGTGKSLNGQPSATYGYKVRACNTSGCGPYSAIKNTVVTLEVLGVPSLTAPTTVDADVPFTVSWTSVSGATQYIIERSRNGATPVPVYDGTGNSLSQHIALPGTYRYQGRACNSSGCGATSSGRLVTVEMPDFPQLMATDPETSTEAPQAEQGEGGE